MSSKTPSPGKSDPRIPPREIMVTRHKSAQMKRQLRTKNRSMKHLTDLLKSPTKETQTSNKNVPVKKKQASPKAKQSLLKSVEKIQNLPQKTFKLSKVLRKEIRLVGDEEYYPNKRKRKLAINKVVLKPKTTPKVVGEITGSVKRKYAVPLKASDNPTATRVEQPSPEPARLTMSEAIRIMDEQLTDEDMMEILTCPSPVWWEDPPDERYVEDPLFSRASSKKKDATPAKPTPMEVDTKIDSDTDRIILIPNLSAKSDKFLKKRSKLEDLLGNIKDKSTTNKNNTSNKNVVVIPSTDSAKSNEIKHDVAKSDKPETKMSESDDEIVFHNSSMNEDELLKDLENMDIPIANQNESNDVIVIDDDDDDFLDKPSSKETATEENKKTDNQETVMCDTNKAVDEITLNCDNNIDSVNEINKNDSSYDAEVPKNLPALQKCHVSKEIASPKSSDSISSKSSASLSSKDLDTISDTNVRFLLDDEIDDQNKVTNNKMDSKNEDSGKRNVESKDSDKGDGNSITVYKIIEEISETPTDIEPKENTQKEKEKSKNSKLQEAYKNCIKVYQKRIKFAKKDTDINKNEVTEENFTTKFCDQCKPNFKRVSDEENVKYCLNCSSIFDSKDCTYCIKNSNRTYTCVPCKLTFCCAAFYKAHEKSCHKSCRDALKISDKLDLDPNLGVLSYQGYPVTISRF